MLNSGMQSADGATGNDTLTEGSGKKQKRNSRTGGSMRTPHPAVERSWALGHTEQFGPFLAVGLCTCFLIFKMRIMLLLRVRGLKKLVSARTLCKVTYRCERHVAVVLCHLVICLFLNPGLAPPQ